MMLEIHKSELIPLIVSYYRKQLQESAYQIYIFQRKYQCSVLELKEKMEKKSEEDFEAWDDYIAWKGHLKSAESISHKIDKIENGLFEIV